MDRNQAERILAESQELISNGRFRNFAAQAHSRAILQYLEADPTQWPDYTMPDLDEDLLSTAHLLLWQGMQLRTLPEFHSHGDDLIKRGAEILEFLYSQVKIKAPEHIDQLFNAALGYYIAGHYARSYVLMQDLRDDDSLPQEMKLLRRLFLRDLAGLRSEILGILTDRRYSDIGISTTLRTGELTGDEALDQILRASINRAFSYFLEFVKSGRRAHIEQTKRIVDEGIELTEKIQFVQWWWLFCCARHLFDEFDANSLWTQLRPLQDGDGAGHLVELYVRSCYHRDPPVLELWRSQVMAMPRVNGVERRSYCLKMPTSAGKTRIAELAILRFLLDYSDDPQSKCIYIAPFRSLAVELESSLRQSFSSLGIRVSELYGGFELNPVERMLMKQTRIIIATPEKIDAFLRYDPEFAAQIRLVIIDEGHIISSTDRGIRFEFFLHRLVTRFSDSNVRFFLLSAVLPNLDQFAAWITGASENIIESDWRPSRLMLGELRWTGHIAGIYYTHSGYEPIEHDCYVSSFIQPIPGSQLRGTRRRNPFPQDMSEVIADAALRFAQQDMTLVFVSQKRSVEPFGRRLLTALRLKDVVAEQSGGRFSLPVCAEGRDLLNECIALAKETMGADADVVKFLQAGFAIHHSKLPQRLRIKIEQLVRRQIVQLVVATTTLAQGVNFPIRTIIVHSLHHGHHQPLNSLDFWNICGRAGRAMKENEGQVLFAVDLTKKLWQRSREEQLRQEMIRGFRTYRLLSALRQSLSYIVQQWQNTHPAVDVAELCQFLAENSLDWVASEHSKRVLELLELVDAQLIALTEEQDAEDITPEFLQTLLQHSLLILQLESEPEGVLTADLANDLLYARLKFIHSRFPTRNQRQRFYQLGFRLPDCEKVEENGEDLFRMFMTAEDYHQWDADVRCDFLASILGFMLQLQEMKPSIPSLPSSLKENWKYIWSSLLKLWLQGCTPNEMVEEEDISVYTTSAAEVSILIDDLFGYRAPWGLNALSAYLHEMVLEDGQELPTIATYFSAFMKYGVHSPVASSLLAFGLESRKLALKLAEQCPNEAIEPADLLVWFVRLTREELITLGLSHDEVATILETQVAARNIAQMALSDRRTWTIPISISDHIIGKLQEGDTLVLQTRPDIGSKAFTLYTLWGDAMGTFEVQYDIPEIWSSHDLIGTTILRIEREIEGNLMTLRICEL
jgi:superfamily II DNA/RNA helicase